MGFYDQTKYISYVIEQNGYLNITTDKRTKLIKAKNFICIHETLSGIVSYKINYLFSLI